MRIPVQFLNLSKNKELDLVSPSSAPHSIKNPFLWKIRNTFSLCINYLTMQIQLEVTDTLTYLYMILNSTMF